MPRIPLKFITVGEDCHVCVSHRANHHGYIGVVWAGLRETQLHRIIYELHFGPIPADMVVDHICFNKRCCNPKHLQILTRSENSARQQIAHNMVKFEGARILWTLYPTSARKLALKVGVSHPTAARWIRLWIAEQQPQYELPLAA